MPDGRQTALIFADCFSWRCGGSRLASAASYARAGARTAPQIMIFRFLSQMPPVAGVHAPGSLRARVRVRAVCFAAYSCL
jgi:hypothetical protein